MTNEETTSPGETVTMPIQEFAGAVQTTTAMRISSLGMPVVVEQVLRSDRSRAYKIVNYFKNVRIINEEFGEAPVVDILGRFRGYYWRSAIAIEGYDEVKEHFACHKAHEPPSVDWVYVKRIIKRWRSDRKADDND